MGKNNNHNWGMKSNVAHFCDHTVLFLSTKQQIIIWTTEMGGGAETIKRRNQLNNKTLSTSLTMLCSWKSRQSVERDYFTTLLLAIKISDVDISDDAGHIKQKQKNKPATNIDDQEQNALRFNFHWRKAGTNAPVNKRARASLRHTDKAVTIYPNIGVSRKPLNLETVNGTTGIIPLAAPDTCDLWGVFQPLPSVGGEEEWGRWGSGVGRAGPALSSLVCSTSVRYSG